MTQLPPNPHIELRAQGYYLTGTRISLDSIALAVERGETADGIRADFPALSSPARLDGAIAFIESQRAAVRAYLAERAERWERCRELNPPELVEKIRRRIDVKGLKTA